MIDFGKSKKIVLSKILSSMAENLFKTKGLLGYW